MASSNECPMDMSLSPSMSTQCPENLSPIPSSIKTIYSKLISSCQRSDGLSSSVTPDKKEEFRRMVSPFISRQVPFNPFNHNLKERLENPIFSPGVFSTVISPSRDSEEFKWNIDDISRIKPAQIEEEFHFEELTDEQTESEMQKTIDHYFTKNHMIPSPWDCKLPTSWNALTELFKKENQNIDPAATSSPCLSLSHLELVAKTPCQNVSTQTALSLPPDLPDNINSALKPYFSVNDLDDINLSMNSRRRKLFCQNDDEPCSPVRFINTEEVSPVIRSCYPSTPVINNLANCSPLEKFSPVDVSPIKRIEKSVKCNNSSYMMQVDSAVQEMQNTNVMVTQDSMKMDQTDILHEQECCKVFDSPRRLTRPIRRIPRKRRRSLSQDINFSFSCSSFAKQSTKQTIHKISSCTEYRTFTESSTTDNFMMSQDTGYGSECTNIEKSHRISSINYESTTFESWNKENKENNMIASTPTK